MADIKLEETKIEQQPTEIVKPKAPNSHDRQPIVKENKNLSQYYKLQPILNENEFDEFMQGLKETLPASFRINAFDQGQAAFIRRLIEEPVHLEFLTNGEATSDQKPDVKAVFNPLAWYPNRLAWQMNITRLDLKRWPLLQQLHKFFMAETDNGIISRQEAVSMIPPLLLDVQRGQVILDMCAAPGSKTAQLLEYLTQAQPAPNTFGFDAGLVVANDVDNKRCYMLVHQSSRLNSPNCMIINQDASRLPEMKTVDAVSGDYIGIKFDRILCDVPCSGDGTIRKNPDVWKKWTVGNANNFHGTQIKILRRGIELLKEDGLLVYSTCSMNPVEDEAVIGSLLRSAKGTVVLEEIGSKLPTLKYRPGLSEWIVMNRDMEIIPDATKVPEANASQIYASLFPPSAEEKEKFNLDRCIRILPHLQNTGGFFVALLRKKTADVPWVVEKYEPAAKQASKRSNPNPKRRRFGGYKEDPFQFMDEKDADWINIKTAYGIRDDFPVNQLVHRCITGKKRSIYLVSKQTRDFILANAEKPERTTFVKIINGGMRLFGRAQTESGFRICQDGISEIEPYIKDDIKVALSKDDLDSLMKHRTVPWHYLSSAEQVQDKIKAGSFVLIYKHKIDGIEQEIKMPLVAWKGERCVSLYVSNTYRVHLCAIAGLNIDTDCEVKQPETGDDKPSQ